MTTSGQNFEIFQGDNKTIVITVRNPGGSLTNLTGYGSVWCAYNQTVDNIVLLKTTLPGQGITIPNPEDGRVLIELGEEDTELIIPRIYGHQCEVQDALGHHSTVTTGYVKVLKSITHPHL